MMARDGAGARVAMRNHLDDVELAWEDMVAATSEQPALGGPGEPELAGT